MHFVETSVLVGLIAGWLARIAMNDGGYWCRRTWSLGSSEASWAGGSSESCRSPRKSRHSWPSGDLGPGTS